jgi:hypothetical protein
VGVKNYFEFTVEDIRRVRDEFYEGHRDMDFDAIMRDIHSGADEMRRLLDCRRPTGCKAG